MSWWERVRSHGRTLGVTAGIGTGLVVAYGASFLAFRNFTVASTRNSCFGTVGVARFTYGAGRAERVYPLAKGDARVLFAAARGTLDGADGRAPPPPTRGWPWRVYAPLERTELWLRGHAVVGLTAAEEEEMGRRLDRVRDEPPADVPY